MKDHSRIVAKHAPAQTTVKDPSPVRQIMGKFVKDKGVKIEKPAEFKFERVFSHFQTNQQIYQVECLPLVMKCVDGYNACIFAYG